MQVLVTECHVASVVPLLIFLLKPAINSFEVACIFYPEDMVILNGKQCQVTGYREQRVVGFLQEAIPQTHGFNRNSTECQRVQTTDVVRICLFGNSAYAYKVFIVVIPN